MPSQAVQYDLYSVLMFGKYKGKTIEYIINNEPTYLDWAIGYIKGFTLTDIAQRELDTVLENEDEDDKYNYLNDEFWKD